eukprot:365303-Chlamydomonas_euryale.AAC.4
MALEVPPGQSWDRPCRPPHEQPFDLPPRLRDIFHAAAAPACCRSVQRKYAAAAATWSPHVACSCMRLT